MILGLQIVAIIFALVMIYFAYLHYKKADLTRDEVVVWLVLWIGVIVVVIFPNYLRELAKNLFITRLFDLLVVGGFVFLITITSIIYIRTKKLDNKLERIIREDALKDVKKEQKK
jgi:hypothetical protein